MKKIYRIELQGHNDGLPYEEAQYSNLKKASRALAFLRNDNPRVKWRLIEVLDDFS